MSYDQAIDFRPNYPEAHNNRGGSLKGLGRLEEALLSYDDAIRIQSDYAEALHNRGIILQELSRFDEALMSYDKAIGIRPGYAEVFRNKALLWLLLGDFLNGWRAYEWRWRCQDRLRARRGFEQPLWLGEESLSGKTILLHSEQGLGDTIQFCRYIPLVAALGATVVFELPGSLVGLLRGVEGVDRFVALGEVLPEVDFHCPLMSLPLAFGTTLGSIPLPARGIDADAGKTAFWSGRMGEKTRPRIGLVWSGNSQHSNDHNRSISLTELLSHLPAGYEYVSLQREVRESDQSVLDSSFQNRHFGLELEDFTDTAALCGLMDLVISVDTSVVHLSATMARPTWVLLPYLPDWRWLLGRQDSPWYPSARLFRQACAGDWASVLGTLGNELAKFDAVQ
jgi:hypothetical protein